MVTWIDDELAWPKAAEYGGHQLETKTRMFESRSDVQFISMHIFIDFVFEIISDTFASTIKHYVSHQKDRADAKNNMAATWKFFAEIQWNNRCAASW